MEKFPGGRGGALCQLDNQKKIKKNKSLFCLGRFDVEDIDHFVCTHLVFGFAGLHPTKHVIQSLGRVLRIQRWNC